MEFVIPDIDLESQNIIKSWTDNSQYVYDDLIKRGVKKEDARFVLPEATCTELMVTGNLQAWLDFINLRSGKEVQWEIRNVARIINSILAKECPNIFKEIE